jgi:hypothetical protein
VLGLTLGAYMTVRCTGGTYVPWKFDGTAYPLPSGGAPPPNDGDFYWHELFQVKTPTQQKTTAYAAPIGSAGLSADKSPILERLWTKALAEWT